MAAVVDLGTHSISTTRSRLGEGVGDVDLDREWTGGVVGACSTSWRQTLSPEMMAMSAPGSLGARSELNPSWAH